MKAAPIQLTDYFLTELRMSANPKFDPKQEVPIRFEDFQVILEASPQSPEKRDWQVSLTLNHQPPAEANVPYRFSAAILGFFLVHPDCADERIEPLVKTNGASMLFGALREIIRDTTARGPYSALFLPATSFYESAKPAPQPALDAPASAEPLSPEPAAAADAPKPGATS
jgi:preprotein translocase subunit SecB